MTPCYNEVILVGKPELLQKIIEAASKPNITTLEQLQKALGFEGSDWGKSISFKIRDSAKLSKGMIELYAVTDYNSVTDYWDLLYRFLGLNGWICKSINDISHPDCWIENDPDGIWFSDEYVYFTPKRDEEWKLYPTIYGEDFTDAYDLEEFLNRIYNRNQSLDEWKEFMEWDDCYGKFCSYDRYGDQVYPYHEV